ncbi:NAD-dependent epimerase/dehydratase family protein [Blautia obeum]|jgi:UDP-glucuronate decarboxylase|uniref:NAD-dependent epimerase/dehydratase family protein n=1 Tax=Blautia obeum TaxID=40520 RepID=A0A454HI66_9FIRM|nr:NAD-dependent epimerase/dehydratase family protein [Blautia obeum]RHC07671.1 NAD-dependent epimerase/dehydratase family protein [Blautia obeum]RHK94990.1 NAD-dependent epimerase/dehydratase family protein [Blautia obeum]
MRKEPLEEDLDYIARYPLQYEQLKDTTVLVTGATGLIGVSIVRALIAIGNIHVIALVRNIEKANKLYNRYELDNIDFVVSDITAPVNIRKKIDWIFHCAAVTTSKLMIEKPVETLLTAIEGTRNILEVARKSGCKSMVYISSMEMYGAFKDSDTDITEDKIGYIDPLKVRSNYPESKRLCENLCVAYMKEYGVKVKIARLAQTFGAGILPSENRVFAQFAKSAIEGKDIVLHTKGLSEGNYCYTRDCVLGLFTILLKGENGEAYNVSNPKSHTTIGKMAHLVANRIAYGKIKVVYDIPKSNVFGYASDTKMKLNSDKLQALGWKPEIDLENSYKRMIEQMKINAI